METLFLTHSLTTIFLMNKTNVDNIIYFENEPA